MEEWRDLHNDNGDDEQNTGKDFIEVEIEFGNSVVYECLVEVSTYRDLPCNTEVVEMYRVMFDFDGDGSELHRMALAYEEFPHYIARAAEKKVLEMK